MKYSPKAQVIIAVVLAVLAVVFLVVSLTTRLGGFDDAAFVTVMIAVAFSAVGGYRRKQVRHR